VSHPIYRVVGFQITGAHALGVKFDDTSEQQIHFEPGPLRDLAVFNRVRIDLELHTLVWPNGADFDPATLHDWPQRIEALTVRARQWEVASV
jgi:hypothetical protein